VARAPRALVAALTVAILSGACAQGPLREALGPDAADTKVAAVPGQSSHQSELQKATEYWGKAYAKNPRDLKAALAFARNLRAMGEKGQALSVLQQASIYAGNNRELAGEYGRLALEQGQLGLAQKLLDAADDPARPDWRIVSARGTALAKQGQYKDAIPLYERALTLSHNNPSILSNLAMAHVAEGQAARAEELLRLAVAEAGSDDVRVRQNLALVLGLQGKHEEAQPLAARDLSADAAASDTEYVRRLVRNDPATEGASAPASVAAAPAAAAPVKTASAKAKPPLRPTQEGPAVAGWATSVAEAPAAMASGAAVPAGPALRATTR
jgi:Flp pilus assembly protein TadD